MPVPLSTSDIRLPLPVDPGEDTFYLRLLKRANRINGGAMGKVSDILGFISTRKKYWLAPVIVLLILLGLILVAAQGSALAPFIYAIF